MAGRSFTTIPGDADFYRELGLYIAAQRQRLGLSQQDFARELGVTFQQVQKYETADNRVPVSVLYKLSHRFGIAFGPFIDADHATCDYRVIDGEPLKKIIVNITDQLTNLERLLKLRRT